MIWLIVASLYFVILGSCQTQHGGSKNNIFDPYISKPPALGEEAGEENRGIFSDFIRGGAREALGLPNGPGGGYYPNGQGGGGGHYPNAGGSHHPSAAGAGGHVPSAAGAGVNYQYGETETGQKNYLDYSAINNMESAGNRKRGFGGAFGGIINGVKGRFPNIKGRLQPGLQNIKGRMQPGFQNIKGRLQPGWQNIKGRLQPGLQNIKGRLQPGWQNIKGRFPNIRPSFDIGGGGQGPSYNYGYEYDTYGNYQEESEFPTTKFTESPYIGLSLRTSTVEPRFDEGFGNPLRFG